MENKPEDHGESQEEPGTASPSSSYHVNPRPSSQLTPLTAATTSATLDPPSTYCQAAATSFAHEVSGGPYYADYDWSQQPGLPVSDAHAGAYYGFAERPELVGAGPTCADGGLPALYAGFPSAEFYAGANPAVLWGHHHTQHYHPHGLSTSRHHHHQQQQHPPPHPAMSGEDPYHATLTSPYLPTLTSRGGSGATSGASSSSSSSSSGKPKRRRVQSVTQRKAANIRERRRMFHLNTAFDELRKRLPAFNYEKRLSRIETLRLAMTYIGFMKDVTMGQDPHKVKLRTGTLSDAASDLSHVDLESCTSDDHTDDLDC